MQPLYFEAIQEPDTRVTSRLRAKWAGSLLGDFVRRPAVKTTLAVTAAAVGGWLLYDSFHALYDNWQSYQDAAANREMLEHLQQMSGSEAYNMMQNGADVDYSQYTQ